MRHYQIAVLPGDGIGHEVIPESVQTLAALAQLQGDFHLDTQQFDWGSERYLREGAMMPKDGLAVLERGGFDGILLGPIGDPRVPDHLTLWGLLLPLRQGFDQYINLRPMRLLPGVQSPLAGKGPAEIDMICVRENTEGEYAGVGGRVHQGTAEEVAVQSMVFTRTGTERVMRYAFEYARQHGRKRVTSATKSNSMQYSMVFWDEVFGRVAAGYPDIAHEQQLIDSLAARVVTRPESLDMIVASNLFGDILIPQREPQPRAALSEPLSGDSRLGTGYCRQGCSQPHRVDLVRATSTRPFGRTGGSGDAHACHRGGAGRRAGPYSGPGWHGDDASTERSCPNAAAQNHHLIRMSSSA